VAGGRAPDRLTRRQAGSDHARRAERFVRGADSASKPGMGIGLYLVQEVARAHGGRVLVDSRPGVGSEFKLELPRM